MQIERLERPEPDQRTSPMRRQLVEALRTLPVGGAVAVRHDAAKKPVKTIGGLVAKIMLYELRGRVYHNQTLADGRVQIERTA